jgi:TetR/AcrR family transcriptional regulator, cholesterol catabolism regulator
MKERILTRAFELFRQNGIKAISMDDIANDLGISKKTIYKFFEKKDQLVAETLAVYLESLKNTCPCPVENALEEFCRTINAAIQKLMHLPNSFFYDLKKYHHQAYQIWQEYKLKKIILLFQANFSRGIKSGLYRPDINPEITARLYVGQLQTIYSSDLLPPEEFNIQETYRLNFKQFVLGIASTEGLKNLNQYQEKYCLKKKSGFISDCFLYRRQLHSFIILISFKIEFS